MGGPWYVGKLSLSIKCKNLQINSNLSLLITSANPGVDITLLFEKYDLEVGFCTMLMNKNRPKTV